MKIIINHQIGGGGELPMKIKETIEQLNAAQQSQLFNLVKAKFNVELEFRPESKKDTWRDSCNLFKKLKFDKVGQYFVCTEKLLGGYKIPVKTSTHLKPIGGKCFKVGDKFNKYVAGQTIEIDLLRQALFDSTATNIVKLNKKYGLMLHIAPEMEKNTLRGLTYLCENLTVESIGGSHYKCYLPEFPTVKCVLAKTSSYFVNKSEDVSRKFTLSSIGIS